MLYAILLFFILIADQLTKIIVAANGTDTEIITGLLSFIFTWNDGAAFSMLSEKDWAQDFFIILTGVSLIVLTVIFLKLKKNNKWLKTSLIFIIGGAIGNFIDRIAFRKVVDFIFVHFFPAVFNIADAALTVGCIMLVVYFLFLDKDCLIKIGKKKGSAEEVANGNKEL